MITAWNGQTVVIKVGTSTLTGGTSRLSRPHMLDVIRQIAMLHQSGYRIVIVSSGAIAAGRERLNYPQLPNHLPVKQMLSAVGQGHLMQVYSMLFDLYSVQIGQVLLTHGDLSNRTRYLNARDTLNTLLDYGILPIVNENDTVAVEEIKVGDNDNLSAHIAILLNAALLIILTDQDGLYDRDPRQAGAQLIPRVEQIDERIIALGGESVSGLGVGGMATKIHAAQLATRSGTRVIIANGQQPDVLVRLVASGEELGTTFLPALGHVEGRKRWLLTERPQGVLQVDGGAARVLRQQGASLLPVGVRGTRDEFERGAVVLVVDETGRSVAQGLVNYTSAELERLRGHQSQEIVDILGYTYGDEAIHRDNMVLI